uniref:Uncharacterized protein n=1 Tax=Acrobeloides nanus TaxID=290746 RepID=A0A914DDT4_9BILA
MPIVAEARTILWTDSKCVLSWILASNIKVPVFEANRLREIKSAAISDYRYVPTDKNPSDLGTRGCTLPELVKNNLWWHGPKFLEHPEIEWPEKQDSQFDYREWLPSPDENFVVAVAQTEIEAAEPVLPVERYGNWEKFLHVIALSCRFLFILRQKPRTTNEKSRNRFMNRLLELKSSKIQNNTKEFYQNYAAPLTAQEICKAEFLAIKEAQSCHPPNIDEMERWQIEKDENGIWRCGGRMSRSELSSS